MGNVLQDDYHHDGSVVGLVARDLPVSFQVDALLSFGKVLIIVTKSLREDLEDLKQFVPWLLTYKLTHAFLAVS